MEERKPESVDTCAEAAPAERAPAEPASEEIVSEERASDVAATADLAAAAGAATAGVEDSAAAAAGAAAAGAAATGATGEDWQKRCQTAEASLAAAQSDAKEYYRLAARYGEAGPDAYARFVTLRRAGLAPEEAFGALLGPSALASAGLAPSGLENSVRPASKAHLLASAPKAYGSTLPSMSPDEMRLARSLFGEELSAEELEALYRRVVT